MGSLLAMIAFVCSGGLAIKIRSDMGGLTNISGRDYIIPGGGRWTWSMVIVGVGGPILGMNSSPATWSPQNSEDYIIMIGRIYFTQKATWALMGNNASTTSWTRSRRFTKSLPKRRDETRHLCSAGPTLGFRSFVVLYDGQQQQYWPW